MAVYTQQFGFADETVWGTPSTPDHFLPIVGEGPEFDPTWGTSNAVFNGGYGAPVSRSSIIKYQAAGDFTVELSYSKLGLLLRQMLGSSGAAPTLVSAGLYKQVHQVGTTDGKQLTMQLGRNEVSTGTVKPFTYTGVKVDSWQISVSDGDTTPAQLALTTNAKNELTATGLASATYATGAAAGAFSFGSVSALKIGGTAATTTGVIAVTGGTPAVSLLKSLTLSGAVPNAGDRFGLGNAGAKLPQANNAVPTVTGSFAGEFSLQSEIYDVWRAQTTVPLQITFGGTSTTAAQIGATGSYYTFDVILPAVKIKKAPPHINGYDLPQQSIDFEAFRDDVSGNNICQITVTNGESSL